MVLQKNRGYLFVMHSELWRLATTSAFLIAIFSGFPFFLKGNLDWASSLRLPFLSFVSSQLLSRSVCSLWGAWWPSLHPKTLEGLVGLTPNAVLLKVLVLIGLKTWGVSVQRPIFPATQLYLLFKLLQGADQRRQLFFLFNDIIACSSAP